MPTNVNSSKSTEMRHMRPYVHYHCPCPDLSRNDNGREETKIISEISDVTTISTETETESTTTTTTTTTKTIINLPPLDINSPCIHFTTFNISKLYFCGDCHQIRCPNCVQEEIVCYYCPNCLFEVPTASVKSERNRCARNCFQCPICKNTLSVMASVEPTASTTQSSSMALISHSSSTSTSTTSTAVATTTASSSNPASDTTPSAAAVSGAPFYLLCSACRWDSQEIGLTFDKASGLALQLQNSEDEEEPDVKEFHHLREHFEKHLRHAVPPPTLQSALISIAGISSFSSRHGGGSATSGGPSQKSDDLAPYKPAIKVENESGLIDDLVQLKNINQITTLTQRMDQLSNQPYKVERLRPQRTHLRTKRIKRCRQCRHILIKPEQKAQETRFKIKLAALSYIPKITIASLPKLILNQTTQIVLKFSNPLYEDISLDLGVQDVEFGKIKVLAPHFNVAPYSETWEYDDQDLIPLKSHSHMSATSALKSDVGIYERKNNSTSIILEITPEVEVEEFKFALLVTYTTSKTVDNNSESMVSFAIDTEFNDKESSNANIITPNAESSASNNNPAVESKTDNTDTKLSSSSSSSSFDDSDQVTKSLSFWTVIGLGSVVKSGPSNKHMSIGSGGINDGSISLPHNSNTKPSTQK